MDFLPGVPRQNDRIGTPSSLQPGDEADASVDRVRPTTAPVVDATNAALADISKCKAVKHKDHLGTTFENAPTTGATPSHHWFPPLASTSFSTLR